jgi:hypothetical protein
MNKKAKKTVVIFRVWTRKSLFCDVIALFPEIPASQNGHLCSSYEHIGQHGAADENLVARLTRPAKPHEYRDLQRELEGHPYNYRLIVRQRNSRKFFNTRKENS